MRLFFLAVTFLKKYDHGGVRYTCNRTSIYDANMPAAAFYHPPFNFFPPSYLNHPTPPTLDLIRWLPNVVPGTHC